MFARLKARYTTIQWLMIAWALMVTGITSVIIMGAFLFVFWKMDNEHVIRPWQEKALLSPEDLSVMVGHDVGKPEVGCDVRNPYPELFAACGFTLPGGLYVESRIEQSTMFDTFQDEWMRIYGKSKILPYFDRRIAYMTDIAYLLKPAKPVYVFGDETLMWRAQSLDEHTLGALITHRLGNYTYSIIVLGGGVEGFDAWEQVLEPKLIHTREAVE